MQSCRRQQRKGMPMPLEIINQGVLEEAHAAASRTGSRRRLPTAVVLHGFDQQHADDLAPACSDRLQQAEFAAAVR